MDKTTCRSCFTRCHPRVKWVCPIVGVHVKFLAECPMDEPGGPVELNHTIIIERNDD